MISPNPSPYWLELHNNWKALKVDSCQCEFCQGVDICTIQKCWNSFYGHKKPTSGSSAQFIVAKTNADSGQIVTGPMKCVRCQEKNDYAEPTRSDGTYMCFNCRNVYS